MFCGSEHIERYHAEDTRCSNCMKVYLDGVPKEHSATCATNQLTEEKRQEYPTILSSEVMENLGTWMIQWKENQSEDKSECLFVRRWKFVFGLIYHGQHVPQPCE